MISRLLLDRISELLFVYAVRKYLIERPQKATLLSLYSHKNLAAAIRAIHRHPANNWSLGLLAHRAMMSRTVFTQRFKAISGWMV